MKRRHTRPASMNEEQAVLQIGEKGQGMVTPDLLEKCCVGRVKQAGDSRRSFGGQVIHDADRKSRRSSAMGHNKTIPLPRDVLNSYADVRIAAVWNSCRSTAGNASPRKPIG